MKYTLIKPLAFIVILFSAIFLNAQNITQDMVDGHNGYFKTYEDFINNRPVHFEELKFHHDKSQGKDHIIWSVTFEEKGTKTTLNMNEFWGFRFRRLLFRTYPSVDMGVVIVVAVGDMILYEGYHSPHIYISDDGTKATYESFTLNLYVSKSLGSEIVDDLSKLKPEQAEVNPEIYDCSHDLGTCYLTYSSILYACKFPGYKLVNHQVDHAAYKKKPSGH